MDWSSGLTINLQIKQVMFGLSRKGRERERDYVFVYVCACHVHVCTRICVHVCLAELWAALEWSFWQVHQASHPWNVLTLLVLPADDKALSDCISGAVNPGSIAKWLGQKSLKFLTSWQASLKYWWPEAIREAQGQRPKLRLASWVIWSITLNFSQSPLFICKESL